MVQHADKAPCPCGAFILIKPSNLNGSVIILLLLQINLSIAIIKALPIIKALLHANTEINQTVNDLKKLIT